MSNNQNHEQRRFAIDGIKNTGFYYTKSLVDGKYKLPTLQPEAPGRRKNRLPGALFVRRANQTFSAVP